MRWHKRFSDELAPKADEILTGYLERGFNIAVTLLEFPNVPNPARFAACNVILQRAILVEEGRRQTLLLRSYLSSAADEKTFVNFVPAGGIEMTFPAMSLWFPLELTSLNTEPESIVSLDVLTQRRFEAQLPKGLKVTKRTRVKFRGKQFQAARELGLRCVAVSP